MSQVLYDIDSYKASHFLQYPPGTEIIYSYLESRGGDFSETVFFGLRAVLENMILPQTPERIHTAYNFYANHGVPFNKEGWLKLLGKPLPLRIMAVPEGTVSPTHTTLMTVENTDPEFFWLTTWVETMLMRVWYPTTVATISRESKKIIYKFLQLTSEDPDGQIPFKLHDFGSRGVSSYESAMYGGAAHLVNFKGTDTIPALLFADAVYKAGMPGFSIPAAEHSTITAWGKDGECDAYRNMLDKFAKPGALVAVVSDSYNLEKALQQYWCGDLKQQIIDSGATIIIRPDSGTPADQVVMCLRKLEEAYGAVRNKLGYKVLNHMRVIQGDGVDLDSIDRVCSVVEDEGFSIDNVAFGMGGALLQKCNRDTLKFAYKCSWAQINGNGRDICKQPTGDPTKWSKSGRQDHDGLVLVYDNGLVGNADNFEEIRKRAALK